MGVYQPMIARGAAAPAAPEQWAHVLERLVDDGALRRTLVRAADELLTAQFGWDRLESSMLGLLARAAPRLEAA